MVPSNAISGRRFALLRHRLTEIVQDIGKMQSLTDLDLFNNDFTTIPDSICTLPQLRRLFLVPDHDLTFPIGFAMFIASSNVDCHV